MSEEKHAGNENEYGGSCGGSREKEFSRLHQTAFSAKWFFYELPRKRGNDQGGENHSSDIPSAKLPKRVVLKKNNQCPMP